MKNKFLVPIVTPFNDDETVNYDALYRLTKKLLSDGADGIYSTGSSAECFLLSEEERKKTLETVIKAADGAYVVAHVGAVSVKNTMELARHAVKAGANAIASVPPFYFNFPFDGIVDYYREMASLKTDVMVYSIPSATVKLSVEQYCRLLSIEGVKSIKYTDTDYFTMQQIIASTGAEVYSGKDECFLSALAAGASGAIGTTFNFMLDKYLEIYSLFRAGENKRALEIQSAANAATAVTLKNLLPAVKYLIGLRYGIECGGARKPFLPLDAELKTKLDIIAKTLF